MAYKEVTLVMYRPASLNQQTDKPIHNHWSIEHCPANPLLVIVHIVVRIIDDGLPGLDLRVHVLKASPLLVRYGRFGSERGILVTNKAADYRPTSTSLLQLKPVKHWLL